MRANHLLLLDLAIFRMNYAVQLFPHDFYTAFRLAGAIKKRADDLTTPAEEKDQYLKKALTAACLSYRVTPTGNVGARNDLSKLAQSLGMSDKACREHA